MDQARASSFKHARRAARGMPGRRPEDRRDAVPPHVVRPARPARERFRPGPQGPLRRPEHPRGPGTSVTEASLFFAGKAGHHEEAYPLIEVGLGWTSKLGQPIIFPLRGELERIKPANATSSTTRGKKARTCSTSRRSASTRTTSRSFCAVPELSMLGTASSSSSRTSTSSSAPTTSSTWGPKAGRPEAVSSPRARRKDR